MRVSLIVLVALTMFMSCKNEGNYTLTTNMGDMKIKLLSTAPKHKANFEKLVSEGFYSDLLFHRVIKGFMIQGGDPESKGASIDKFLGQGGLGYTIPAEIGTPHFKGMISAARLPDSSNPQKESSACQFFIVQGSIVTDEELDAIERTKGIKYSQAQRDKYKKVGGSPSLDGDYTVYGEVIEGLEIIDKIANIGTDTRDRPQTDVVFSIK